MTLEEAEKLDDILKWLNNKPVNNTLKLKNKTIHQYCEFLDAKGYIIIYEIVCREETLARLGITKAGIAFLKDGGFVKYVQNENKDEIIKRLEEEKLILSVNELKYKRTIRTWKAIALGLSIASYLIGYAKLFQVFFHSIF